MYEVIKMTIPENKPDPLVSFNLESFKESAESEFNIDDYYSEAVFANGKKSVESIIEILKKIKDQLMEQINEQDESYKDAIDADNKKDKGEYIKNDKVKKFDPVSFWRNPLFKQLEDEFSKVFGFRDVSIEPYIEKWSSKDKVFESMELNAEIYHADRFPIEGLVTDKGFYDKSKSIRMNIYITLGLIKELTPEELMAVILHEFGHSIDPALVDIKYTEINILSKYLTDRRHKINNDEKRYMKKYNNKYGGAFVLFVFAYCGICTIFYSIKKFINWIKEKIIGKEKVEEKKLEKVRKMIQEDKDKFNRKEFSEAFADNFARMYGFGPQLISGLKKMDKDLDKLIGSRIKKEKSRQEIMISIVKDAIDDVHKTILHRAHALVKEYKADIADPNTSKEVKKQLEDDLEELEKILHEYETSFSSFQNRINKIINEELDKIDFEESKNNKNSKSDDSKKDDKSNGDKNDEPITESRKAYEKMMKEVNAISTSERNEFYKIFGKSQACSLAKDKDGYYVRTHQARSKSYPDIKDIPKKDVEFVRSTS